jgi:NAD(P)-dependent dehydrogenase (short-subunit alcohol dehydrogenase family)
MEGLMNVLITGTSSGFGLLTTRTLAKKGHTVFASMRGLAGKNAGVAAELRAWAEREGVKVHTVELDIAKQASVDAAVKHILDSAGHIDVVVNNAGIGAIGITEAFTAEQALEVFDIDVVGVQRVNRAVLPSMRARGSGLLVHVSSVLGRVVFPYTGLYDATKYAIESLAESYRYELALTGVDSVIVEPGVFGTDFLKNCIGPADAERAKSYGEANLSQQVGAAFGSMGSGANAPSPQLVADAIAKLVETPVGQRPLRTVVAPGQSDGAEAINGVSKQVQEGTFGALGLSPLLQTKAR